MDFFVSYSLMVAFHDEPIMKLPEGASNPNVVTILERDFPEFYALLDKADMVKLCSEMSTSYRFCSCLVCLSKSFP